MDHNILILTDQQAKFFEFVKQKHGDQKRKYTGEPYWHHLVGVAEIVSEFVKTDGVIEIALGHDLLEDTNCREGELFEKLKEIGYELAIALHISRGIYDLTDQYTSDKFPSINRKNRKEKECNRLSDTNGLVQSIKYADLIDNTSSIVQHDPGFAAVYLQEKKQLLNYMRNGNIDLFIKCCHSLYEAQLKLKL